MSTTALPSLSSLVSTRRHPPRRSKARSRCADVGEGRPARAATAAAEAHQGSRFSVCEIPRGGWWHRRDFHSA
eukprot:scaffold20181_cov83-Isochrysis_galbana.AAC.1